METSLEIVVFLGGPLDGYQRAMAPDSLARLIEFDISENTFRIMARLRERSTVQTTSTAVYQLGWVAGTARYHFLASMPPHVERPRRRTVPQVVRAALRKVVGNWFFAGREKADEKPNNAIG